MDLTGTFDDNTVIGGSRVVGGVVEVPDVRASTMMEITCSICGGDGVVDWAWTAGAALSLWS